ncbi:MAG: MerR family transcriptional regulator [Gammaproteobacteria bacterium]
MKTKTIQARNLKRKQNTPLTLPEIPNKCYFTIGEVGVLCAVKPHVLRYWELEFTQLKPIKRRGNRRYYQMTDVLIARRIRKLLYDDGFTIEGARLQLQSIPLDPNKSAQTETDVKKMIADLEGILQKLKTQEISQ